MSLASIGDPEDPDDWSGITAAAFAALRDLGHDPTWLSPRADRGLANWARRGVLLAQLPAALRLDTDEDLIPRLFRLAELSTLGAQLGGSLVSLRRRRARAPRCAVQIRGDFAPGPASRTVILEDMTVAQVAAHRRWGFVQPTPAGLTERRIAHQRAAHRRAHASCAATEWVASALREDYGVAAERVHVVGFGAEALADGARRDWRTPRLLWVGLDWERKGGDALVRALARLRETHGDAELHLVGHHPEIDRPGIVGHGRLDRRDPRQRAELGALFARSTMYVMPSALEPAGIVHAEAGLAGLPNVGSTSGGAGTMIGPGGYLVDPGEDEALTTAILRLADPDHAQRVGALSREHARLLTWPCVGQRLVRALDPQLADARGYAAFLVPTRPLTLRG